MNRKHNPFVSLVALVLALLLALIMMLTLTGCNAEAEAAERDDHRAVVNEATETEETEASTAEDHRFTIELSGRGDGLRTYVLTDTTTGQQYLFVDGPNYSSGLTALLPGEG